MCVSACCSCVRRAALSESVRGPDSSTRTDTTGSGARGTGGTTGALAAAKALAVGALAVGALVAGALVMGALVMGALVGPVGSAGPPSPSTGRDDRPGDRPPPSPRLVSSSAVGGWLGASGLSFLAEGDDSLEAASDVSPSNTTTTNPTHSTTHHTQDQGRAGAGLCEGMCVWCTVIVGVVLLCTGGAGGGVFPLAVGGRDEQWQAKAPLVPHVPQPQRHSTTLHPSLEHTSQGEAPLLLDTAPHPPHRCTSVASLPVCVCYPCVGESWEGCPQVQSARHMASPRVRQHLHTNSLTYLATALLCHHGGGWGVGCGTCGVKCGVLVLLISLLSQTLA